MSRSLSTWQPDDSWKPANQEFNQWLEKNRCQGIHGPAKEATETNSLFVPFPDLQAYFAEQGRIKKILRELFPTGPLPILPDTIQENYIREDRKWSSWK